MGTRAVRQEGAHASSPRDHPESERRVKLFLDFVITNS